MNIKTLGVWASIDQLSAEDAARFAIRIEDWGYGALWIPEAFSREVFTSAAWLLAGTRKLTVASGIANIYARDAFSTVAAQNTLSEQSAGRFLLGLGVSHVPLVEGARQHHYGKPVATMRAYVEAMSRVKYRGIAPAERPKLIIAALGPKMLELAAELTDGAHPYNVPPEHTERARRLLGKDKMLCVEQAALLESDPGRARAIARKFLAVYVGLPNYVENWRRLGYGDADFAHGGSDSLIDAVVAWGDEKAIRMRLDAHLQAGADHVCVQPLSESGRPDENLLELLAPAR